jgi:hypothetical protein
MVAFTQVESIIDKLGGEVAHVIGSEIIVEVLGRQVSLPLTFRVTLDCLNLFVLFSIAVFQSQYYLEHVPPFGAGGGG